MRLAWVTATVLACIDAAYGGNSLTRRSGASGPYEQFDNPEVKALMSIFPAVELLFPAPYNTYNGEYTFAPGHELQYQMGYWAIVVNGITIASQSQACRAGTPLDFAVGRLSDDDIVAPAWHPCLCKWSAVQGGTSVTFDGGPFLVGVPHVALGLAPNDLQGCRAQQRYILALIKNKTQVSADDTSSTATTESVSIRSPFENSTSMGPMDLSPSSSEQEAVPLPSSPPNLTTAAAAITPTPALEQELLFTPEELGSDSLYIKMKFVTADEGSGAAGGRYSVTLLGLDASDIKAVAGDVVSPQAGREQPLTCSHVLDLSEVHSIQIEASPASGGWRVSGVYVWEWDRWRKWPLGDRSGDAVLISPSSGPVTFVDPRTAAQAEGGSFSNIDKGGSSSIAIVAAVGALCGIAVVMKACQAVGRKRYAALDHCQRSSLIATQSMNPNIAVGRHQPADPAERGVFYSPAAARPKPQLPAATAVATVKLGLTREALAKHEELLADDSSYCESSEAVGLDFDHVLALERSADLHDVISRTGGECAPAPNFSSPLLHSQRSFAAHVEEPRSGRQITGTQRVAPLLASPLAVQPSYEDL